MPKRKVHGGQTEIPVNVIGFKHDPDAAYGREYGEEKLAEQHRRFAAERRCTCGSPFPEKWGARWKHKPPCPRAGRKF